MPAAAEPSGSFTTECTATGAQADVGTSSEGGFSGGSFRLVADGFSATVTSGQQDVVVPADELITLQYVPAEDRPRRWTAMTRPSRSAAS